MKHNRLRWLLISLSVGIMAAIIALGLIMLVPKSDPGVMPEEPSDNGSGSSTDPNRWPGA